METITRTIDVEEERDEVSEAISEVEERIDELEAEAVELSQAGEDGGERWQEIAQIVDDFEALLVTLRGRENALERAVEEWEGTEVSIRELTGAETRVLKDDLRRDAAQAGVDDLPEGAHETRFLERAIESTPPGCPEPDEIGDLPDRVFEWLLGRANALNTVGEFEMGNSSLGQRVAERQSQN